jgi:hypothetical protein
VKVFRQKGLTHINEDGNNLLMLYFSQKLKSYRTEVVVEALLWAGLDVNWRNKKGESIFGIVIAANYAADFN